MEIREYAERVVLSPRLEDKVRAPSAPLTDDHPGTTSRIIAPAREASIALHRARGARVPPIIGYQDVHQRARILHALANHELQAAELFAWALLAFPDTPSAFRRGLLAILVEEQEHFCLYRERIRSLDHDFGDFPVTGHFWNRIGDVHTPIEFICAMGLTFENANLDFAGEYAAAATACGDTATADVLAKVHEDEIRHVAFAWRWLVKWERDADPWNGYLTHIKKPLGPERARGKTFDRESRRRAGMDDGFIDRLEAATAVRPSGRSR